MSAHQPPCGLPGDPAAGSVAPGPLALREKGGKGVEDEGEFGVVSLHRYVHRSVIIQAAGTTSHVWP